MSTPILYLKTIPKLGLQNVAYVIWYRFSLKTGIRKRFFPVKEISQPSEYFFTVDHVKDYPEAWKNALLEDAEKIVTGTTRYYSYHWKSIGNPPDWFLNPFNKVKYPNQNLHWTKLSDFHPELGDIKNVWEASRFEWLITLSRAYTVTGNIKYLETLNLWLKDWSKKNPLNTGPNWKCGQEASIRVFNLINTALILKQSDNPTESLSDLIFLHLQRISPNIRYALAQNNNHGTSEAAALYIGGLWLEKTSPGKYKKASLYNIKGRKWLENRVKKLITNDGSFSQHSVTYHRVLIDTLIFAEYWRERFNDDSFSEKFYLKTKQAIKWLFMVHDIESGNAPNLGPNDGAMFVNLHSCQYRDFRPSLQTANVFFNKTKLFSPGNYDEPLLWFEKEINEITEQQKESCFFQSGYSIIKAKNSWALFRFPFFKFRPVHNDIFHFDLWHNGKNIICDAGTFSYNPDIGEIPIEFSSVHAHNTVSFDNANQMPKISRFLMGKWIKPKSLFSHIYKTNDQQFFTSSYKDFRKNIHERTIKCKENQWIIEDKLSGSFKTATIGFNINDQTAILKENLLQADFGTIESPKNSKATLTYAFVSDYYFEKHSIKRVSISVNKPGKYITIINLT